MIFELPVMTASNSLPTSSAKNPITMQPNVATIATAPLKNVLNMTPMPITNSICIQMPK